LAIGNSLETGESNNYINDMQGKKQRITSSVADKIAEKKRKTVRSESSGSSVLRTVYDIYNGYEDVAQKIA
jgi:hypothetical protein